MITRIEIDGFKSFRNFAMDLRPFQVIVGANGVGKSNLFDAIMLLSRLATSGSIFEAFNAGRGSVPEQFGFLEDGSQATKMKLAVEMQIPETIRHDFDDEEILNIPSMKFRYEIIIGLGGDMLSLISEYLAPVDENEWNRFSPIRVVGRKNGFTATSDQWESTSTGINRDNYNEAFNYLSDTHHSDGFSFAMREEMRKWRILNPIPSAIVDSADLANPGADLDRDANNLVAVLKRMNKEDESALHYVGLDMTNAGTQVRKVDLLEFPEIDKVFLRVTMNDGKTFSANVLSDGTLRLLALATLRNDPSYEGVLCYEEPENGVQPQRMEKIVNILKGLATDFDEPEDNSLRQVIISTHSPALLAYVDPESIAYLSVPRSNAPRTTVGYVTEIDDEADERRFFTIDQVRRLLDTHPYEEQLEKLQPYRDDAQAKAIERLKAQRTNA